MIPSSSRSRTPNLRSDSVPRPRDANASSSIRPRNRRLNTLEDQELSTTSATSTPSGSRAVSPIPAKHPSRSGAGTSGNGRAVGGRLAPDTVGRSGRGNRSPSPSRGIWNTGWMSNTLQQVASSVLGSVAGDEEPTAGNGSFWGSTRQRNAPAKQWGPPQKTPERDGGIGTGSTSEREAAVRAKKMRRVLEGRDEEHAAVDTSGNYKRRTSVDEQRPGSSQEDGHALVYVHHIQPQDTYAGIVLRYNCPREVFRKSNGLWNDSLGFRKTVVLPVDACAIKGRPCEPPSADSLGVDLLAPTPAIEDPPPFTNGDPWPPIHNGASAARPEDDDKPWSHVRWVLIDSSPSSKPVEIARMPRKTLGYFPPRRRKSQGTLSTVSTPRGSLDSKRLSQTSNDIIGSTSSTPSRRTSNLGPRPSQLVGSVGSIGSYFPPAQPSGRSRRESVGETADRLGWMRGPGGVGTLGKGRMPGPGRDGLNNWTRKNLPGIAIDSLPSSSILGSDVAHFGFNDELAAIAEGSSSSNGGGVPGTLTPSGQGLGLENAAAAVEGFFRKLAVKGVPGTPKLGGRSETADLIELLDGTGSDDGMGFELSRSRSPMPSATLREDLEGAVRGRASAGAKGGKGD